MTNEAQQDGAVVQPGTQLVVTVYNNHVPNCGLPPQLDSRHFRYLSVFQNEHGEQMVFTQEAAEPHLTYVQMGDCGWVSRYRVIAGILPGINLGLQEQRFVLACWRAATRAGSKHGDGDLHDRCVAIYSLPLPLPCGVTPAEMLAMTVDSGQFAAAQLHAAMASDARQAKSRSSSGRLATPAIPTRTTMTAESVRARLFRRRNEEGSVPKLTDDQVARIQEVFAFRTNWDCVYLFYDGSIEGPDAGLKYPIGHEPKRNRDPRYARGPYENPVRTEQLVSIATRGFPVHISRGHSQIRMRTYMTMAKSDKPREFCPDCGVKVGEFHDPNCDVARCQTCGYQAFGCACTEAQRAMYPQLAWTGIWPNSDTCAKFGWYAIRNPHGAGWVSVPADTPGAQPDLNRLYTDAVWDPQQACFILKAHPPVRPWQEVVLPMLDNWSEGKSKQAMIAGLTLENDLAESLGFTCTPDRGRGHGWCRFARDNVEVWEAPAHQRDLPVGWLRGVKDGIGRVLSRYWFRTLEDALRNRNPCALMDKYGAYVRFDRPSPAV